MNNVAEPLEFREGGMYCRLPDGWAAAVDIPSLADPDDNDYACQCTHIWSSSGPH